MTVIPMRNAPVAAVALLALGLSPSALAQNETTTRVGDIEEIIVQGYRDRSYLATDSSTATLFSMPIEETPFNIGVITERLIDDLQINTLRDSVLLNSSVVRTHSHSNNATGFTIRGFAINADQLGFLVNGVPVASFDAPPAHVSALDRIEVIKGTSALYYGAGEPAGVINYAYKTPQEESRYAVQATVGEHDVRRAELDATGKLGSDQLLYRFTLGWQDSEGVVDYDYAKDLAPTLQLLWKPIDRTDVRFIGEYVEHEGNPISADTFYLNGDYIEGPEGQYFGFSTDYEDQESRGIQVHVDHAFRDNLKLKVQAGWKDSGREAGNSGYLAFLPFPLPGFNDPANGLALRSAFDQERTAESEYVAAHVAWDIETGDISHEIVIGINYSENEITNIGYFNSIANVIPEVLAGNFAALFTLPPSVNIYDPVTVSYDHLTNFDDSPPFYRDTWRYDDIGLNLQDAIDIPSLNLHILLGLRYNRAGYKTIESLESDGSVSDGFRPDGDDNAWIPRVGVVYDINDRHSVYLSYGESYKPPFNTSRDRDGNVITEPETGEQYEIGWRGSFLGDRLSTTLAAYELTKKDIIKPTGIPNISEVSGEDRSKGFELDVAGQVTDGWDIYLSYAYTDTEIIDAGTTSAGEGDAFAGVPEHKAVLWNNFSLDWTGIEGLNFGYGMDYSSDIIAGAITDIATLSIGNVDVDGQGLIHNANLSYSRTSDNWDLHFNLGFRNITDEFYVLNTTNTLFAKRGEPRSVLLSVTYTYF